MSVKMNKMQSDCGRHGEDMEKTWGRHKAGVGLRLQVLEDDMAETREVAEMHFNKLKLKQNITTPWK